MRISIVLEALTGSFETDMDRASKVAQKRMREIESRANQIGKAIGVAFVAAATAIAVGVKHAIDQADALNDLHERLGLSAEALSGFAYAAKQTGTDIDSLGDGMKRLSKNMAEALNPKSGSAGLFAALNVDVIDKATGKLRDLEEVLPEIADRFKGLHDETLEAALAQELFGKSGTEFLEFLNLGSDGINKMRGDLRSLGGELSQDTLSAADEFNDKLGEIDTAIDAIFTSIASQLLPEMIDLTDQFREWAREAQAGEGAAGAIVSLFQRIGQASRAAAIEIRAFREDFDGKLFGNVYSRVSGFFDTAARSHEEFLKAEKVRESLLSTQAALGNLGNSSGRGVASARAAGASDLAAREAEAALRTHLSGGGVASAKAHAAEVDKVTEAYERMKAQMLEQIALFGQTSEAAHLRYQLEQDELVGMSAARKQELIDLAEKQDLQKAEAEEMERLNELEKQREETIEQARGARDQALEDLQFEIDLLGKSNAERAAEIELRRIGIGLSADEQAAAKIAIEDRVKQLESLHEQIDAMDEVRGSFEDIFQEVAKGQKSLLQGLEDFADAFIAELIRMAAAQASTALFGQQGQLGGGLLGGLLNGIFGGVFGTSPSSGSGFSLAQGFASGTDYAPGGWAIVGEQGPELVNLPRGSEVIPNHEMRRGGGGGDTFIFNDTYRAPTDPRTREQVSKDKARQMQLAKARA